MFIQLGWKYWAVKPPREAPINTATPFNRL